MVGLHRQYIFGIDYTVFSGKKAAMSIVNSGRYHNRAKNINVLTYSRQGELGTKKNKVEQKLEHGNLALVNNIELRYPIKVIRNSVGVQRKEREGPICTYNGLYNAEKFYPEKDSNGIIVFKFKLRRLPGESRGAMDKDCYVTNDVSSGKENMAVRVTMQ